MKYYMFCKDKSGNIFDERILNVKILDTDENIIKKAINTMKHCNKNLKPNFQYIEILKIDEHGNGYNSADHTKWSNDIIGRIND